MKKIAILGSTGSIGTQTLEIVRENKDIEVLELRPEIIYSFWKNRSGVFSESRGRLVGREGAGTALHGG